MISQIVRRLPRGMGIQDVDGREFTIPIGQLHLDIETAREIRYTPDDNVVMKMPPIFVSLSCLRNT